MKQTLIILAMSSIVAYGQQKCDTCYPLLNRYVDCIIKKNSTQELRTDDSVRILQVDSKGTLIMRRKCDFIFNNDSTQLTYVCESDSMAYEAKVKEVKPSPFKKMFLEALEAFIIVVLVAILMLFLLACGL